MATQFLPVEALREAAGRAAGAVLTIETARTQPVVTRTEHGVTVLVLFFPMSGRPPAPPRVRPPTHAMWLDGATAKVLRFWATSPEDLGFPDPLPQVPGAGEGITDPIDTFLDRRDRWDELSPDVWRAFEAGATSVDAETRAKVAEYYALFLKIVIPEVAPFYTCGAPDFFGWIGKVLSNP
jgi:hypothetical protein